MVAKGYVDEREKESAKHERGKVGDWKPCGGFPTLDYVVKLVLYLLPHNNAPTPETARAASNSYNNITPYQSHSSGERVQLTAT